MMDVIWFLKYKKWVCEELPEDKPRHLLGVGEPEDIFEAVERGVDTFDCVSPTRLARHGAAITSKKFEVEPGSISSTWGGGHILDMAIGLKTIEIIKKKKLLNNINKMGNYLKKDLNDLNLENVRGKGLMLAFDLQNKNIRNNFVIESLKHGLVLLGCGEHSIRVIPPYIVSKKEIDQSLEIVEAANNKVNKPRFKHTGKICNYLNCGESHT